MQIDAGTSDSEGIKKKKEVRKLKRKNLERSNSEDWTREDRYSGGSNSRGIVGQ